jgi:CheY-like chemotaxis protein
VTTAINGHEAYNIIIESLKKKEESGHQHHMLFDIVLLDLNMPISDGFEACQKILKLYDKDSIFKIEK